MCACVRACVQEMSERLRASGKVDSSAERCDALAHLSQLAQLTVGQVSAVDVATQLSAYARWSAERQADVDDQLDRHRVADTKRELARRIVELRARDEKLRYFETEATIELRISERPADPHIEEAVCEEEFVPPPSERRSDKRRR